MPDSIHRQRARKERRPARRGRRRAGRRACARRRRARPAARSITPRARCRCCACPRSRTTSPASRDAAARLGDGATDIVILGTGGSSLGGQTLAQLAVYAVPGVGALARRRRACISSTISIRSRSTPCWPSCRWRPRASSPISKSGGTAETLMQTIAALSALKQAGLDPRDRHARHQRAGQSRASATACAICSAGISVPMLDHDPGVGGRFSVLTNVGLLPAAMLGLDIAAIRKGAAAALAPVLAKKKPAEVPAALGAALAVALAEPRQADQRADGLLRPARALHALVRAALGREPRQGRQGHHAARRARPGRPAQPGAALSSAARATSCSPSSPSAPPASARAWTANSPSSPASRALPARPSAISSPRKAAPPPRRSPRTAARCARIHLPKLDEAKPRRTADAFHAGDDHRRASPRHRRLRPAGGGRGQGAGEEVFDASDCHRRA